VFSYRGEVVLLAELSGVEPVPDASGRQGRWQLVGTPVIGHPLVGHLQPVPRSYGNPVGYGAIA
jgi:hypothetical protein